MIFISLDSKTTVRTMATLTTNSGAIPSSPLSRLHQSEVRSMSVTSDSSEVSFTQIQSEQKYTDDDLQGTVKRFVRHLRGRYPGCQVPTELLTFVSHWLCGQLQYERKQWNTKLTAALNQVEVERRQGLAATDLVQVCLERLQLLVQSCKLYETDLHATSDWKSDPNHAILLLSQTLMEVYSHLVEDHLQCLDLLDAKSLPETVQYLTVNELLRQRLGSEERIKSELKSRSQQSLKDKQVSRSKSRQNQTLETLVKSLESDVGKLRLALKKEKEKTKMLEESADIKCTMKNRVNKLEHDVQKLKEQCTKKQDYIDWLKKQFFEMTKLVADEKKNDIPHHSGLKHATVTESTSLKVTNKATGNASREKVTNAKVQDSSSSREVKLTRSPGSAKSAGTSNSTGTQTSIEISEDKLNVLKLKAKKLEDSLRVAMNQMSEYAAKSARKTQAGSYTNPQQRIAGLASQGVILRVPKKINMLKTALGKTDSKMDGRFPESHRNAKLDKSFKELQNAFANRQVTSQNTGQNSVSTSSLSSPRKNQVSKCFRCKKIFRMSDNHKLACCFHMKGKERIEKYGEDGKLKQVVFVWQCCGQKVDNPGCCTGHHV